VIGAGSPRRSSAPAGAGGLPKYLHGHPARGLAVELLAKLEVAALAMVSSTPAVGGELRPHRPDVAHELQLAARWVVVVVLEAAVIAAGDGGPARAWWRVVTCPPPGWHGSFPGHPGHGSGTAQPPTRVTTSCKNRNFP
jgi:hypothetical protein